MELFENHYNRRLSMKKVTENEKKQVSGGWTYTVKCSQCNWTMSKNFYELIGLAIAIGTLNQYKTNHESAHGWAELY